MIPTLSRDPVAAVTTSSDGGPLPSVRRRAVRAVLRVAATVVVALAVTGALELVHALNDPWEDPLTRLSGLPVELVLLGATLVWAVILLLLALTGRLAVAVGATVAAAAVIGFADYEKMRQRSEPLYPSDTEYLGQLGLLVDLVGRGRAVALLVALIAVVAVVAVIALRRRRRGRGRDPVLAPRQALVVRGASAVLAGAVLVTAAGFNEPGNVVRRVYEAAEPVWAPWNQTQNYAQNGFVTGLLYNLPAPAMSRPAGYDAAAMEDVLAEYRAAATSINASRDPAALADTNVVVVLGETFSDPLNMQGVRLGADPIPFTRDLMETLTSGTMLSSGYGGGTANVEFEVLTGMALANFRAQTHTPYQSLVPYHEEFPSFLRSLGEPERATLAVHPYVPSFYRRDAVYEALGFERATFRDGMEHTGHIERDPFISDAATYEEVVDELRASERPVLLNIVTMQNHPPYTGKYDDPVAVDGPLDEAQADALGQYARGLQYSDQALEQLVSDLEALGERTVVLFYGDHLPSLWPQEVLDLNPERTRHETPYFVYATFDTDTVGSEAVLGPNFLVPRMLAAVGAPVTPYDALLEELAREVPALQPDLMLDPSGEPVTEAQLSDRARELLEDYRLVQYDLAVGEGYAETELFEVPAG